MPKWQLSFVLVLFFAFVAGNPASGAESGDMRDSSGLTGWQQCLSHPEIVDVLAKGSCKTADEFGLDGLTQSISLCMELLEQHKVPKDEINVYLARIWITSINAALLQDMDPFRNPAYQAVIDKGMDYAGSRLAIPDPEECMQQTVEAIIRAQKSLR